jgi:hypothetical protein
MKSTVTVDDGNSYVCVTLDFSFAFLPRCRERKNCAKKERQGACQDILHISVGFWVVCLILEIFVPERRFQARISLFFGKHFFFGAPIPKKYRLKNFFPFCQKAVFQNLLSKTIVCKLNKSHLFVTASPFRP